ncbi:DUF3450 domain-containing protein [Vibrio hippocampi]|uniref:DUF3450 domain-containing protein n=1 Tax=Vibrio hippocampi TaxID=654686 RepID=A0ABN8DIW3_9VIBR|nr:DUF3450 domain-containing protein [Vibrio hippocampi]CAH0529114.1 hypothetical protein VHP8226_03058 [Vibrio hippocampi]
MFRQYLWVSLFVATSASVNASSLDSAQGTQNSTHVAAAASQQRIDTSATNALSLQGEIEQLQQQVNNLEVYGQHLTALIASQNSEVSSLNAQIDEIKFTRQGIVPLMYQMIADLKQQVQAGMPIKQAQRLERVEKLDTMMVRADVSDAEKYRRILEAHQIELDYGTKLSTYQGEMQLGEQSIEANMLHLGRLSLVARSLDRTQYWAWNAANNQWQALDNHYATDIDHAFSVANKQTAPSLISLPISTPVTTQQEQ